MALQPNLHPWKSEVTANLRFWSKLKWHVSRKWSQESWHMFNWGIDHTISTSTIHIRTWIPLPIIIQCLLRKRSLMRFIVCLRSWLCAKPTPTTFADNEERRRSFDDSELWDWRWGFEDSYTRLYRCHFLDRSTRSRCFLIFCSAWARFLPNAK